MAEDSGNESKLLFNLCSEVPRKKKKARTQEAEHAAEAHNLFPQPSILQKKSVNFAKKQQSSSDKVIKQPGRLQVSKGKETLHSSSLFKSNPEVLPLVVNKQKNTSEPLFSSKTFGDLNLHPHLVSCLKSRLKVEKLTKVQEQAIPVLLEGRDALVRSCTGSGKTLAYAVPVLQKLQEITPKIKRSDGVYALVVVPTRELALQCFECFSTLTNAFIWIVPGYLIGGEKKKSEKTRIRKGINILISTPGRLLDHLEHTKSLSLNHISWLIIDEADRLLEQGFEESVMKILHQCSERRHTVLLSATLSKGVENLAGISLSEPVRIDIASNSGMSPTQFQDLILPGSLEQFITVVPSKLRLAVMSGFIIDNCLKSSFKGLIFMSSQSSVDFHYSLFNSILVPLINKKEHQCKFFQLRGNMKQEERTEVFRAFKSAKEGVLLCTDVAARGLDLLHVDWIVQYSVPHSVEIYVHRVGRTARIGKKGRSLLFLLPSEREFSNSLSEHKINFEEIPATKFLQSLLLVNDHLSHRSKASAEDCATALQTQYEEEVYSEKILHQSAKDAFASYVQSYASYPKHMRNALPFRALHLGHVAKSFCLREAPSELGVSLPNSGYHKKQSVHRKIPDKKPLKRKMQAQVSEFDSGFSSMKQHFGMKKLQAQVSEYDSGFSSMKQHFGMKSKRRKH